MSSCTDILGSLGWLPSAVPALGTRPQGPGSGQGAGSPRSVSLPCVGLGLAAWSHGGKSFLGVESEGLSGTAGSVALRVLGCLPCAGS